MPYKEKILCPVRLYENQYKKVKAKVAHDGVSFQKLVEVLIGAYLKNNRAIMNLVSQYSDVRNSKKRRYELDEIEKDELLRKIEEEYSPLKELENTIKEIEEDEE